MTTTPFTSCVRRGQHWSRRAGQGLSWLGGGHAWPWTTLVTLAVRGGRGEGGGTGGGQGSGGAHRVWCCFAHDKQHALALATSGRFVRIKALETHTDTHRPAADSESCFLPDGGGGRSLLSGTLQDTCWVISLGGPPVLYCTSLPVLPAACPAGEEDGLLPGEQAVSMIYGATTNKPGYKVGRGLCFP